MNRAKLAPSHVRKVIRARRRWARLRLEERFGFYVRRWPLDGTAPAELGRLLAMREVSCVVDVGAHTGAFGRILRRLGFNGDIVSFEPASSTFEELVRRTRGDPRWTVHRMALGATTAHMELRLYEQTQLNSLRQPLPIEISPIDERPRDAERVEVVRLDDVWRELVPTASRVLLKVDAQGFDLEVLKGAQTCLTECVALQTEVSGIALYDGSPPLQDVVSFLYDRSFRMTGLFPVARRSSDRAQVLDFDATFVRIPDR